MGEFAGGAEALTWFLLPAATLAAWLVRVVGSLRRRDASYGLMPVLAATVLALVLLVASFVLPGRDVVTVNALATLVLVLGLAVLEVPLWGVRTVADVLRGRRPVAPEPTALASTVVAPVVTPVVAEATVRPDEAA